MAVPASVMAPTRPALCRTQSLCALLCFSSKFRLLHAVALPSPLLPGGGGVGGGGGGQPLSSTPH